MRRLAVASVAAAALLIGSAPDAKAHGGCPCGSVSSIVKQYAQQVIDKVNKHTTKEVDRLQEIIIRHGKQMSNDTQTQTKGTTDAMDGQTQALAQTIRNTAKAEMQIRMAPPSLPCITPSMSKALIAAEGERRARQQEFANALFSWGNNMDADTRGSGSVTAMNVAAKSLSIYCGPAEAAQGLCEAAQDPAMQDANVKAGTIFSKRTMTKAQSDASKDYINTLINPAPPPRLPGNSYKTTDGMLQLADRDSRDARVSAAAEIATYVDGMRQPVANLASWAVQNTGEDLAVDGKISIADTLYAASVYRLRGDTWYNDMVAKPSDAAIKDLAVIAATDLYVSWERFELEQRQAVALAGMVAIMAQQNFGGVKPVVNVNTITPTNSPN